MLHRIALETSIARPPAPTTPPMRMFSHIEAVLNIWDQYVVDKPYSFPSDEVTMGVILFNVD